jgi:small subunit ribosomal protein S13
VHRLPTLQRHMCLQYKVFILNVNFPEQRLVKVRMALPSCECPKFYPGPRTITDTPPTPQAALGTFFGIGPYTSARILARFHIHQTAKVGELSQNQVSNLVAHLDGMKIDNDLRRQVLQDIQRLRDTGTYRGRRHAMGLPVRGQNTRNQVRLQAKIQSIAFASTHMLQIKTAHKLNRVERKL